MLTVSCVVHVNEILITLHELFSIYIAHTQKSVNYKVETKMKLLVLFIVLVWSKINLCTATGDAEMTVSFTQTSYTVTEGEAVSVCVTATPALVGEAVVVIELMSREGFSQGMHLTSIN